MLRMYHYIAQVLLVAFVLQFYGHLTSASISEPLNEYFEDLIQQAELRALPALRWDGSCPTKAAKCPTSFQGKAPLIVISLDGFQPDLMNRGFTPTLKKLSECGTHAPYMYPAFPSKTLPNHYTIVTGLNPPSHGIVDNNMYDSANGKLFKLRDFTPIEPFWFKKEPLWATAEKQGMVTASYLWPGSNVKINGSLPTYYKEFKREAYETRIDQVLAWLDLPTNTRPQFITVYFNQPDNAMHHYGVKSKQTNNALAKMDKMIERLYSGLQQRNLVNCVNVIILSDHGMSDIDCKRLIDLQKYVDPKTITGTMGPLGRIRPRGKRNITAVNELVSKLKCRSPSMRVYLKEQLPVRMHYADSTRIEPIYLEVDAGWTVVSKGSANGSMCTGGSHGYDNMFPDMRAIFIAEGPAFKRRYTTKPFINTELYEMFAELLNIKPNPNNGTRGSLHHIITRPRSLLEQVESDPPTVGRVPQDEMEYNFRLYASNCSCSQNDRQTEVQNTSASHDQHMPFGVPYSPEDHNTLRLLYNKDYISAFDLKFRIPMWSAFTLKGQINVSKISDICWKGDARIPINDAAKCGDYNSTTVKKRFILQRPLYPIAFSNSSTAEEGTFVTNSIPKSMNHTKILEKAMNDILAKWTSQSGELNVVTGPAFDFLATGTRPQIGRLMRNHEKNGPLVVPTHIFVIATWCTEKQKSLKECKPARLDAHGFLLPNEPYTNNCEVAENVIRRNVARVVDIENLTGLSFYTGLPIQDAIRLRTAMPERTL